MTGHPVTWERCSAKLDLPAPPWPSVRQRLADMLWALDDGAAHLLAIVLRIPAGRRPARRALVLHSPALMLALKAVLDERFPVATLPAPPQLRVELLEHPSIDSDDRLVTKHRKDIAVDVDPVRVPGVGLELRGLEPVLRDHPKRTVGLHLPLLVDLCTQTSLDPLGLVGLGSRFGEVATFAGQRVGAVFLRWGIPVSVLTGTMTGRRITMYQLTGYFRWSE